VLRLEEKRREEGMRKGGIVKGRRERRGREEDGGESENERKRKAALPRTIITFSSIKTARPESKRRCDFATQTTVLIRGRPLRGHTASSSFSVPPKNASLGNWQQPVRDARHPPPGAPSCSARVRARLFAAAACWFSLKKVHVLAGGKREGLEAGLDVDP